MKMGKIFLFALNERYGWNKKKHCQQCGLIQCEKHEKNSIDLKYLFCGV